MAIKPFIIPSFRGGVNKYDPPTALENDQVTDAVNVEFTGSTCGQRRAGHTAITLPSSVSSRSAVWQMHRHLPTLNEADSQLWVFAASPGGGNGLLSYKNNATWTDVTFNDAADTTEATLPLYRFQTLHAKLFVAYPNPQDRLHVWPGSGTTLRRTGLAEPAAPTGANGGGGGTLAGTRYYRVRYTEMSGSTVLRRSEPSDALTFAPGGANAAVVVTKPAAISEGETHWELEASLNNADFYRIAQTVVGTTTYNDTTAFAVGYAAAGTLSEAIGAYTLIPSGKYLVADNDRLLILGHWSDPSQTSRVRWTPPQLALGSGNNERLDSNFDPDLDLDGYEGGEITGGVALNGVVYVFKWSHTYRLNRTGQSSQAYEAFNMSRTIGAIPGSMVSGLDSSGNPAVFFVDINVGPCMISTRGGLVIISKDIRPVWDDHLITTAVRAHGLYYPNNRQCRWEFTRAGQTTTTRGLVLHTDDMRITAEGGRRGWVLWEGLTAVHDMILYADNVESGSARTTTLKPLVCRTGGSSSHVVMADSGTTDDGTAYAASITSKPFIIGSLMQKFRIQAAHVLATAATSVTFVLSLIRNFGVETSSGVTMSLTPVGAETHVTPYVDNLRMSEAKAVQFKIADASPATGQWELHQIVLMTNDEEVMG